MVSTGEPRELSTLLRTRDSVDLAGHSLPTWPWKELTSLRPALFFLSLSSSSSIAPLRTMDAKEDGRTCLSITTRLPLPVLRILTLTLERTVLADTMEEVLELRPLATRWLRPKTLMLSSPP
jgi:hypothetical protein